VAIRPPKYNSQGFTLIEMIVTVSLAGIIMAFALPSLMTLDKPLRSGTFQFKNQLSLIRSKAISGSRAYRIRPKYPTSAQYRGEKYQGTAYQFVVEYAANCQVNTFGPGLPASGLNPNGTPNGWQAVSSLDLNLPESIGVATNPAPTIAIRPFGATQNFDLADGSADTNGGTIDTHLNWSICYDNRGIASQPVALTLEDSRADNRSTSARIRVGVIGGVDIDTFDKNGSPTNSPSVNNNEPVF
jgi:prepilin-type N-terminal cleavage/methylation domain-containing protein